MLSNLPEIGLFCGTFNPIHNAHLLLAQCACDQFKLQKIYFVTSPRPPHRHDVTLSGEARQTMVLQAVADNDKFIASMVEFERPGLSYTIDTIEHFKSEFSVNLLVGADNIIHLPTWHKFDQIIQSCKLLIAPRRLSTKNEHQDTAMFTIEEHMVLSKIKYSLIDSPLVDIASSDIRRRVKQGKTVRYMLPEKVWQSIEEEKYFKMKNIPPPLDDLKYVQNWVKERVSPKRFGHIVGVAHTAKKLAQQFSKDPILAFKAELAGWLHDACKETKDKELIEQAQKYGLQLDPVEEENGHLLHGPVAAQFVKHEFGLEDQDILNAIAEHTLGALNMTLLSKIVFLADAIEPGRPAEYADPIREPIKVGSVTDTVSPLDKAILIACQSSLDYLAQAGKAIHPRTVAVRDYYLKICQS